MEIVLQGRIDSTASGIPMSLELRSMVFGVILENRLNTWRT